LKRLLKKVHKWVGLLIGLQVLLWLISGLALSLLDPEKVSGKRWARAGDPGTHTLGTGTLLEPAALPAAWTSGAYNVELTGLFGRPVYRIRRPGGEFLADAADGSMIGIGEAEAGEIARRDFNGAGDIVSTGRGMAPDMETRDSSGAYWKVDFSDRANTSIYVSASSGEILERRNRYWRIHDFFWMLHIMDYRGHEDLNNPLVITVALIAIWLGLSGFLLLFGSFRRHDFFFLNVLGGASKVVVTLHDPASDRPRQLRLRKGSNLFLTLATHDINLPSICGGGGECGKCRVRFDKADLPDANDIELGLVPRRLREQGYRLACQHELSGDITIYVPQRTPVH